MNINEYEDISEYKNKYIHYDITVCFTSTKLEILF